MIMIRVELRNTIESVFDMCKVSSRGKALSRLPPTPASHREATQPYWLLLLNNLDCEHGYAFASPPEFLPGILLLPLTG